MIVCDTEVAKVWLPTFLAGTSVVFPRKDKTLGSRIMSCFCSATAVSWREAKVGKPLCGFTHLRRLRMLEIFSTHSRWYCDFASFLCLYRHVDTKLVKTSSHLPGRCLCVLEISMGSCRPHCWGPKCVPYGPTLITNSSLTEPWPWTLTLALQSESTHLSCIKRSGKPL